MSDRAWGYIGIAITLGILIMPFIGMLLSEIKGHG